MRPPLKTHRFNLRGDWGGVLDCEVLAVEPHRTLSYTWNFAHDDAAFNLHHGAWTIFCGSTARFDEIPKLKLGSPA
jgi:uncharacterized protein YndB with AHSA1/START domain